MDICQTPPHALEPLYPYLESLRAKYSNMLIWESAVGPEKLLATTLTANGYAVHGTDLMYGDAYNYFDYSPLDEVGYDGEYIVQVTNIPFSIKYKWLKRAFELGFPFAFLVPYETTAAGAFQTLAKKYNGKPWQIEKLTPERRINYKMPNKGWDSSAQMPTCWLTWGLNIHHTKNTDDILFEYSIPMRNARYDDNNKEI